MTSEDYQQALMRLLPQGLAWSQDINGPLAKLLLALGDGYARADEQSEMLAEVESMPKTARTLLDNWESFLGLPDCGSLADTIEQREAAAQAKFTMAASLNLHFYEELAAQHGYDITITQLWPHHCRRRCTARLIPRSVRFTALVTINTYVESRRFTCVDDCMTPLMIYESGELECLFDKYGPAHETFIYIYNGGE